MSSRGSAPETARAPGKSRKSLYLVGFMGCGKTSVGPALASRLGLGFVDTDKVVEERAGRCVADIWRVEGEARFRLRESAALREVAGREAVIATGGGILLVAENRACMRETGWLLWLKVSSEVIWSRVSLDPGSRPLVRDRDSLEKLLRQRELLYATADVHLDIGGMTPQVAAACLARLVAEHAPGAGGSRG